MIDSKSSSLAAIEVIGIRKRFGDVVALDDVSFSVGAGEMFFLLGPSGCGKTTLLRILAGLETPDGGILRFAGKDISELPPHERGAPMVFQNYALWPHLSVQENVAFGLVERRVTRSEIRRRVQEVLQKVNLDGLEARMPGQLSGGQQQRVVLARALVLNPRIVLLDEPLSNLDAKLRIEMREEIERLHRTTDITFVYVTHDQVEALSLADRMAVLSKGQVRALGTPKDMYHRPPNAFCADFLGEANLIPGRVTEVSGGWAQVQTDLGLWRAVIPSGLSFSIGADVLVMVRPENIRPGDGALEQNRFRAKLRSFHTNGATIAMLLDVEGGSVGMRATVLNSRGTNPSIGELSSWTIAAEDSVVVAREPGGGV